MSYRQKYYVMAERGLENRRDANKKLQQERIMEVEAKIPEIAQLRSQLAADGTKIARLILSGEDNVKDKISEIAAENLKTQKRINELLVKNGYRGTYLDNIYSCCKCKDTGIYENMRCSCFMDDVKRFECEDMNTLSPMLLSSFSTFDLRLYPDEVDSKSGDNVRNIMKKNFDYCVRYAEDFHLPSAGILMKGKTGLGKTHLSLAIANAVIDKGYSVIYTSTPDLLRKIEKEHFGGNFETDTAGLAQETDLLILDDLGAEFESKFNTSVLYNILNSRMNSGKPVIVNTNFEISELQQRYGDRIVSRLLTMELLTFVGNDIRIIKKYAKG